jgi:hypothetical protein
MTTFQSLKTRCSAAAMAKIQIEHGRDTNRTLAPVAILKPLAAQGFAP